MNLQGFLTSFLTNFIYFPAIILCFAPMTDRLKKSPGTTALRMGLISVILILTVSFLESGLHIGYTTLVIPFFIIAFTAYHTSLTVPVYKSLFVFTLVFTYMSFMSNYASGFDAMLHPTGTVSDFSTEAALFLALITTSSCILFYFPMRKFGRMLINSFDIPRTYIVLIPVWCIFLGFNLLITPRKYETIHVNLMQLVFWISLSLFLVLFLLLCVLFFLIVSDMMEASRIRERARILEMQESAFIAQQRYMNESARARHDFKHTIGALAMLINDGDYSAAKYYLNNYMKDQPQSETANYCNNPAVNALLNYYDNMAKNNRIRIEMEIALPDSLQVSDIDLCNILGNILENAILAGDKLPEADRFIDLAIRLENEAMYIVATNSFDGEPRTDGDTYKSTRHSGSGIGLRSIRETAEKYGGSARFSHKEKEFYTDVVLPI